MHFPVSGVNCSPLLPPLVGFALGVVCSPAGVSGAFLLIPFQMSVLGYVTPGVSPTNLVFNIVAIPGAVYRYAQERRMAWTLATIILLGSIPGMLAGAWIRLHYVNRPQAAKLFVGVVLAALGVRLLWQVISRWRGRSRAPDTGDDQALVFRPAAVTALALIVGVVGGIYGIGGGAIIAPFLVAVLHLPVHKVAGATLFGTFATSIAGIAFFEWLASAAAARPDYLLGALFGAGGLLGTYTGARLQKHVPENGLRLLLGLVATGLGLAYAAQFFLRAA